MKAKIINARVIVSKQQIIFANYAKSELKYLRNIELDKDTREQKQTHRIPTSFKADGEATKGKRKSVPK